MPGVFLSGSRLVVADIKKHGYDYGVEKRGSKRFNYWDYSEERRFHPNPDAPVILRMRRKGQPTLVVLTEKGRRFDSKTMTDAFLRPGLSSVGRRCHTPTRYTSRS